MNSDVPPDRQKFAQADHRADARISPLNRLEDDLPPTEK